MEERNYMAKNIMAPLLNRAAIMRVQIPVGRGKLEGAERSCVTAP